MSVSDLTGYTWVGNEWLDWVSYEDSTININFSSNSTQFTSMTLNGDGGWGTIYYNNNSSTNVYDEDISGWTNSAYKTIQITGGTDATNPTLIAWLEANGTLTAPTPQPSASISIGNSTIDSITLGNSDVKVYLGSVLVYEKAPASEPYLTFSSPSSFTLKVVDNTKYWNGTLEYSTNTTTWTTWDGTTTLNSGNNNVLYLRGTGNTYITGSSGSNTKASWVLTGNNISCNGNIENLLDYATVSLGNHPTMASNCYRYMFYNCTSLISTPTLPATTLATACYYYMFGNCTSLTTPPTLPATTMVSSCYRYMFYGCSSLTTAPALPATTMVGSCYRYMFYGCTSLTTPPALPATTLASACYEYMFYNCTSLYVSDTQIAQAQYAWKIPTNEVISGTTYSQLNMFANCLGTRSNSTLAGASGSQYTYYTQNQPVS